METARRRGAQAPGPGRLRKERVLGWPRSEVWLPSLGALLLLGLWEWGGRSGRIPALYFPSPSVIGKALLESISTGVLLFQLSVTLSRLFVGFAVGGLSGLFFGWVMGWSPQLRSLVDPFVAAVHPLPKIAILPLVLIVFGLGETSNIIVIAIGAFFPLLVNAMAGVRQISPIHFQVAQNYGASRAKVLRRVVVPGSLPLVLAGTRLALNTALSATIGVELIAAHEGLGARLWLARETLRTEELYANLVVIALVGVTLNMLLQLAAARLAPWQVERER